MITNIVKEAINSNVSDLHLLEGEVPRVRINGELKVFRENKIAKDEIDEFINENIDTNLINKFNEEFQIDFGLEAFDSRIRVNMYKEMGKISFAIRFLPNKILTVNEIEMEKEAEYISKLNKGLILITGSAGSGKSTTSSAIIDYINRSMSKHIVTVEDPIEYIHESKKSYISQREIGKDVLDYKMGLRGALREDADVIFVGEIRDMETLEMALTSAETGQLVIATMHTSSASETIDRVLDSCDKDKVSQVKMQLSLELKMVITQNLIKSKDSSRRFLAKEVLRVNNAVSNIIREGKTHLIKNELLTSSEMIMMEKSVANLVNMNFISYEEGIKYINDKKLYEGYIVGLKMKG
ncbi:MAG: PilT/PilU family type 4a pilus ATPase [Clostridia bacterium]|nr:PilT/PilU family type 4a pilus ATPase [Clostridia bacterium]